MSTILGPQTNAPHRDTSSEHDIAVRRYRVINSIVDGFATQDIEKVMVHFADSSVYCEVRGNGPRGTQYHGKDTIRRYFEHQFEILGGHTYENPTVAVSGTSAFACWSLGSGPINRIPDKRGS